MEYVIHISEASKGMVHVRCYVNGIDQNELVFQLGKKSFRFEGKDDPVITYEAETISGDSLSVKQIDPHIYQIECMGHKDILWKYDIQLPEQYVTYMDAFVTDTYAHIAIPQVFMTLEPVVDSEVYVKFDLPDGWNIVTLWNKEGDKYHPANLPALRRGYMALGDYKSYESKVDDAWIKIAISKELNCNPMNFFVAVAKLLQCQAELFQDRVTIDYLIICNSSGSYSSGGSPSRNIVSLALPINFTDNSLKKLEAGRLSMINHELMHTWIKDRPLTSGRFWYTEGFTSYCSFLMVCRAHYITEDDAYQKIYDNVYIEYIENKYTGKSSPEQVAEKFFFSDHDDAGVYCGDSGFLFAFLLDIKIRYATQNLISLDHLMRELRRQFGVSDQGWTYNDLNRITYNLASIDVLPLIERYIEGTQIFPIADMLNEIGLEICKTKDGVKVIESRKATKLAKSIRHGICNNN